jgi:phytol kinase
MSTTALLWGCLLPVSAGAWMAFLSRLQRAGLAPEWCRKLLHVGCGLLALGLPWVFNDSAAALALVGFAGVMLAGIRWLPAWNHRLGGVFDGVGRGHRGGFYFAAAVGVVYTAAGGDRLLFCLPVAVLTFADAAAAVVGQTVGTHFFQARAGCKTIEGSAAFFTVAVACAAACLGVLDSRAPADVLSLSMLVALLLTFVEACAGRGTDNLLIPVAGHLLLRLYLGCLPVVVAMHLMVAATAGAWALRAALRQSAPIFATRRTPCEHPTRAQRR